MKPLEKGGEKAKTGTELVKPPKRVGVDINIARHPVFASRSTRGYRTLPSVVETVGNVQVTRTVSVGTYRDTNKTLDTFDELVFMSIYGAWEKAGCKIDKPEDMRIVGTLTNTLALKSLEGPGQDRHYRGHQFARLRESLDKLARVPIEYDNAYETKNGWITTEAFTLLKRVSLFNRTKSLTEGGGYFELTELCLNEDICRNIKDKKFKLFYLEELAAVGSETGKLIYNQLELLGGVIKSPFRRDALEFAKECGIETNHERKTIQKIKRACQDLVGRILTCGVIAKCSVETKKTNGNFVQRTFVCHIKKVESQRANKNGGVNLLPDHHQVKAESERQEEQYLIARFKDLPDDSRLAIEDRAAEISRTQHNGFLKQTSLIQAIREFFSLNNLSSTVRSLTMREPPSGLRYRSTAEVVIEMLAFLFPDPRPIALPFLRILR